MIHTLNNAMTRHAALLVKQRENLAEMFQMALADMNAAIADANSIVGAPIDAATEPQREAVTGAPQSLRMAAE